MMGLAPFRFDMLAHPWFLVLLAGVAVVLVLELLAGAPGSMVISTGETLARLRTRRGEAWRRMPAFLRALGLGCLVLAMAGPLNGFQVRKDRANVIDIMLCVDVSSSMSQGDFFSGGQTRDRLYVTKEAARDFLRSRKDETADRYGLDRIGLVTYAGFAWTQCPLTLDYGVLERELDLAQIVNDKRKDGTAIGSALGLAVRRLTQSEAKSKVIILLTDGLNNRGELDPMTAAQLAKRYGIKVYTIGAGSTEGGMMLAGGLFPVRSQPIDEEMLKKIAESTEGKYYRATDTESLHQAYGEISQLETTEIDIGDYYQYQDAFLPYLIVGAVALLASVFTRRRWFEVIP
jgi:Ca-activated chloride channel family protein